MHASVCRVPASKRRAQCPRQLKRFFTVCSLEVAGAYDSEKMSSRHDNNDSSTKAPCLFGCTIAPAGPKVKSARLCGRRYAMTADPFETESTIGYGYEMYKVRGSEAS